MVKKIFLFLLFVIVVLTLNNLKLVVYGFQQLSGQLHIVINSKPVEQILNDASTDSLTRKKLLYIQEVRKFAIDSLGLKDTKNYTTFYNQNNRPILWVVTGAERYSMKAYEWHFPFIGNVSYKGFFKKERAEAVEYQLKQMGYDTDLNTVGGWSTLGFFTDPILSNMLKRNDGAIAELIIHEMTHATVYLKSSVDFNENLATFIGEKGAEEFLKSKYPNSDSVLIKYIHSLEDEETFGKYVLSCKQKLSSKYNEFENINYTEKEKLLIKYRTIASLMTGIKNLPLHRHDKYDFNFKTEPLPNNTWFLSYSRYRKKQDVFYSIFKEKYNSDLRKFIASLHNPAAVEMLKN